MAYNAIAVLVLEGILVIMWLATFAAVAARRATFRTNVSVSNCFNDGSSVNSKYCYKKRDAGAAIILFKTGADLMSANAGVGALLWYVTSLSNGVKFNVRYWDKTDAKGALGLGSCLSSRLLGPWSHFCAHGKQRRLPRPPPQTRTRWRPRRITIPVRRSCTTSSSSNHRHRRHNCSSSRRDRISRRL